MTTPSPEPVPADGVRDLREALCEATWLHERKPTETVTWAALAEMEVKHPTCVGAMRVRVIRAHVDGLLRGPVGQIIAERDDDRRQFEADKARGHRYRDKLIAERDDLRQRVLCDSSAGAAGLSLIPTVDQFYAQVKRTQEWAAEARREARERRAAEARAATLATRLAEVEGALAETDRRTAIMVADVVWTPKEREQITAIAGGATALIRRALSPDRPETGDRTEVRDALP